MGVHALQQLRNGAVCPSPPCSAASRVPALCRGRRHVITQPLRTSWQPSPLLLGGGPFSKNLRHSHGRAAAVPHAVGSAAALEFLQPDLVFSSATYLVTPIYLLMVFFPRSKLVSKLIGPSFLPVVLGVPYALLVVQAWQSGLMEPIMTAVRSCNPFPNPADLSALFQCSTLTTMAWLHLLLLDFVQARAILLDGLRQLVPTGHSVLLSFMFGPLGLLSHIITRAIFVAKRGTQMASGGVATSSGL